MASRRPAARRTKPGHFTLYWGPCRVSVALVVGVGAHIQALEASFPVGQFADYQFLRPEKGSATALVLKVSVLKAPGVRPSSDDTVYVRRGAQNLGYGA